VNVRRRAAIVEAGGRRILCLDFSDIADHDEAMVAIAQAKAAVADAAPASLYSITDVSDSTTDRTVLRELMQLAIHNEAYVRAGAVVGVSLRQKKDYQDIARVSGRRLPLFDTHDDALAWLLEQD
jgi:hypothetical protein